MDTGHLCKQRGWLSMGPQQLRLKGKATSSLQVKTKRARDTRRVLPHLTPPKYMLLKVSSLESALQITRAAVD